MWTWHNNIRAKYIEGHSEIASGHMRWSRFLLLAPFHPPFTCPAPTKTLHMTISVSLNAFLSAWMGFSIARPSLCGTGGLCRGRLEATSACQPSHFATVLSRPPQPITVNRMSNRLLTDPIQLVYLHPQPHYTPSHHQRSLLYTVQ